MPYSVTGCKKRQIPYKKPYLLVQICEVIPGFSRSDAEPLFGNFVRRVVRWGHPFNSTAHIPRGTSSVSLAVFFCDAKVYSLTLKS